MKNLKKQIHISRRGAGILLAMSLLGVGVTLLVIEHTRKAAGFYASVRSLVDGYRARELSHAGLEAGLLTLRALTEERLFTLGILSQPPRVLLSENCDDSGKCIRYYISYSIQPEDSKLNLNLLVSNNDELNNSVHRIFSRLFEALDIDVDSIGAIVDWIDQNDFKSTGGAEKDDYASLSPPRKIKNGRLYSLSELAVVIGFDRNLIYNPRVPLDFEKDQEDRASIGNIEASLLAKEDWTLSHNVTAYLPDRLLGSEKVNLNAAPYHVLYSLSEAMGRAEVAALFRLRQKKKYIKKKKDVEDLPEMKRPGTLKKDISLAKELFGTGVGGFLKLSSRFYRITGVGFISLSSESDTEEKSLAIRRVWGLWDKKNKQLIYYAED